MFGAMSIRKKRELQVRDLDRNLERQFNVRKVPLLQREPLRTVVRVVKI